MPDNNSHVPPGAGSAGSKGDSSIRPQRADDMDNALQLLAASFYKACQRMDDYGKDQQEVVRIVRKMAEIAKEIGALSEQQVPTMRRA